MNIEVPKYGASNRAADSSMPMLVNPPTKTIARRKKGVTELRGVADATGAETLATDREPD
jgi:hypothetical protein